MTKKEISTKQKNLKKNISSLKKLEPKKHIKNMSKDNLIKSLVFCLSEGDPEGFKEILWAYLEVHNKTQISKELKIPRSTLYHMVSEEGNPTLDVIAKIVHKLAA